MAGSTKYHMTPAGLMRCRHGHGGVSGRARACPYGGPVMSSGERMSMPLAERPPVASGAQSQVVSKQEERRATLMAELRAIRDQHGDDFFRPAMEWAHENEVAFYRVDGLSWADTRLDPATGVSGDEFYLLAEQAEHHGYSKDRWDAVERVPEVLTVDEVPAFLAEARKTLPQTEEKFLASLPQTPYWEDTRTVDEEALLKKFRKKTSRKKEALTPQEVYFLASQSGSPQAKRMLAAFEEGKPRFIEHARKVWREGTWRDKWALYLGGRHHYPFKPVTPAQVWSLLTVEQTWKLAADGVDVP